MTLLLVTACSAKAPAAAPAPTPAPADAECPDMSAGTGGHQVRFGVNGAANLGGVIAGKGTTGIVLSHEADGTICDWDLGMGELVTAGYRVLAFNFSGYGSSEIGGSDVSFDQEVAAAAAALRGDGATKIVLMGASMGACFSVAAAPLVQPPPAAVVSLSAPLAYSGVDALAAAPKLTMPVLFAAEQDDSQFGESAKDLFDAAKRNNPGAQVRVTPGGSHGYRLYNRGTDEVVRAAVNDFLKQYG